MPGVFKGVSKSMKSNQKTSPSSRKAVPSSPVRKAKYRLVLIDDHPIMREGLARLVSQDVELEVCGQFEDAASALEGIGRIRPDLAMVDISLKGSSGIELLKSVRSAFPEVLMLVLSMHDEGLYAERVLRAGASGYVMKQESPDLVLGAIKKVLHGEIFLSEKMSGKLMNQLIGGKPGNSGSMMERLSDRELEIFGLIGQGKGTRQIAEQLSLSVKTVESHRAHIKEKLHLKNATELVHRAVQFREE